jgi:hypothetical protein
MRRRVKRIFAEIEDDIDMIVLLNSVAPHVDVSFFYATGITQGLFEHSGAFLYPDGDLEIISSSLEADNARDVRIKMDVYNSREERNELLEKKLKRARKVGINCAELTHRSFQTMKKLAGKKTRKSLRT